MGALKSMLARGGELPLNRDGAVGWVYHGSVWFVAKRLADQVREHVRANSPEEAIPGDERNDRLFDTWQEYGALE
ncbi:TraI domain-containing protein, partial [Acinetobacter baumannii]